MRRLLKWAGVSILAAVTLITATLAYAYFIEPKRLVTTEAALAVPNFSAKLNGLKIVAISDIHGGSNAVTEAKLREIVARANEQRPDLIVLLGDYVSERKFDRGALNKPEGTDRTELRMPVATIADGLAGFKAKYGTYAVIGNHDWWHNEASIRREFERVGIVVIENEVVPIDIGGETLNLWAIEDLWKHRRVPVPEKITTETRNIIAITHNPDSLLKVPGNISLMLAGHSHGGQVSFPFFGPMAWVNDRRFMKGEAVADGKHVFVTSGIGCTGPQIRFGVPPEIAVVTLRAAE